MRGHFQILLRLLRDNSRCEIWESLHLTVSEFRELGLDLNATDRSVWQACQQHKVILITANRNADNLESLESTIAALNTPESLPVITLADPQRIARDRDYAERAADRLLEYLFDCESLRGVGRLFIP